MIAATSKIKKNKLGWKVPSQSGNGSYIVNLDHGEPFCTCPDYETRHLPCKHIHAVEFVIQRETKPDGTTTATKSVKMTCTQEWQTYEVLCKALCHNICVLIQPIFELGLEPTFWTFDTKEPVVPKVLENFSF